MVTGIKLYGNLLTSSPRFLEETFHLLSHDAHKGIIRSCLVLLATTHSQFLRRGSRLRHSSDNRNNIFLNVAQPSKFHPVPAARSHQSPRDHSPPMQLERRSFHNGTGGSARAQISHRLLVIAKMPASGIFPSMGVWGCGNVI